MTDFKPILRPFVGLIRRYRGALDIDAIIAAARRYRDAHGYGSYSFKFYR